MALSAQVPRQDRERGGGRGILFGFNTFIHFSFLIPLIFTIGSLDRYHGPGTGEDCMASHINMFEVD